MAYVAISKELKDRVSRHINSMAARERTALTDKTHLTSQEHLKALGVVEEVTNLLWGENLDLKSRLEQYCYEGEVSAVLVSRTGNTHSVRVKLPKAPIILKRRGYYGERVEAEDVKIHAERFPFIDELFEYIDALKECDNRWEAVQKQVSTFLSNCKSLNEGIKLWPDLRHYIPNEYLRKLDEQTAKKAKEASKAMEALKSIDTEMLNTSAVLARMATTAT